MDFESRRKFSKNWCFFACCLGIGVFSAFIAACSDGPLAMADRAVLIPALISIETGESVQFDIRRASLDRTRVVWTASPAGVADVDGSGRVVGMRAGMAIVRATDGLATDSAVVTVARASGKPSAPPADPASYLILSDEPFDDLQSKVLTTAWNQERRLRIVEDRTAPRSCCSVAEFFYPRGFQAGRAPASIDFSLGAVRGLYVSIWWKASEGWQGHPSGVNKMMFIFPNGEEGNWFLGWHGTTALRVAPQHPGGWKWLHSNVEDRPLQDGRWYHIEFLLRHEQGEYWSVDWWVDDTLRGSHRSVEWTDADLGTLKLNPTWGGMDGQKSRDDYFRWDHIYISGSP